MLFLIKVKSFLRGLFSSKDLSALDKQGLVVDGLLKQIMHYHDSGEEAPEELKAQLHAECEKLNNIDAGVLIK